jgi:hypothetical protein
MVSGVNDTEANKTRGNITLQNLPSEAEIRQRLEEAYGRVTEANREVEAWQMMLRARRMLAGEPIDSTMPADDHPGNTAAVLSVLGTAPDRYFKVQELYKALEMKGWLPRAGDPRKSLGATLSNLVKRKRIERGPRGMYRLPRNEAPATTGVQNS